MNQSNAIKFRPSLSAAQITHILDVLFKHGEGPINNECVKLLRTFELKARHGIVSPSHIATGTRPDLANSLGFSEPAQPSIAIESLVKIWEVTPNVLSPRQLAQVQLHRYQNDLMTPEEEAGYESAQVQFNSIAGD